MWNWQNNEMWEMINTHEISGIVWENVTFFCLKNINIIPSEILVYSMPTSNYVFFRHRKFQDFEEFLEFSGTPPPHFVCKTKWPLESREFDHSGQSLIFQYISYIICLKKNFFQINSSIRNIPHHSFRDFFLFHDKS